MVDQNRRKNRIVWLVLGALGFVALFAICGILVVGAYFFMDTPQTSTASPRAVERVESMPRALPTRAAPPAPIQIPAGVVDYETAVLTAIYKQVAPSVVNVETLTSGENFSRNQPFVIPSPERTPPATVPGMPQINPDSLIPQGQGSGFVWDVEGHIVTNAHVVEGADRVQVKFSDGTITIAEVVGIDDHSDLAVLKIDPTGYNLVPLALGNMDEIEVGARVAAIGNPFGFEGTLTSGIVSAIGRSIPALTSFSIPQAIQTDAMINPGNSGGPLLNERGEVIGVNAQIRVSEMNNTGIGFAIPVSIVERVVPALVANGVYEHSFIGISGSTYSPICAELLDFSPQIRGAYVASVLPDTPADLAGLRGGSESVETNLVGICPTASGGDLVIAIDNQPVTSFDDLLIYLERYTSPGETVTLTVLRNGDEQEINVTLTARPSQPQR